MVTVLDGGALVGVDARTSGVVWRVPLGRGSRQVDLSVSSADGQDLVTAITSSRAVTVNGASGAVVFDRGVGRGDEAVSTPLGVVIRRGEVSAQMRTPSGQWVTRAVPPASEPVAPWGSDLLSVNAMGQWWRVTSDRVSPAAKQLPSPAAGARPRGVLGSSGSGLLFAWTSKDGKRQLVQQYAWGDLTRPVKTVTAGRPGSGALSKDALRWSGDGTWFVLDQSLVNLATGKVVTLPADWATETVLTDRAYATPTTAGVRMVTRDGGISTDPIPDASSDHVGMPSAQLGSLGLVVAPGGDGDRLFAVTLATAAAATPTPAPSSATKTPAKPAPSTSTGKTSTPAPTKPKPKSPPKSTPAPTKPKPASTK
ncbi:hypothetical protein VV01_00205 [Luteipulveratus halotolerans]|uniref:Uncharacterized protein n=1 Tax=Luteipulveratus halotolerans TaxID=1631356 RepID=A0A0L6CPW3_9MICO|nr:hypothetical protein VV01_00205 [Luteipulveratus halotolerans]